MQLLRSKIIPSSQDAFWARLPDQWLQLSPAKLLVIATPFAPDSLEDGTLKKLIQACGMSAGKDAQVLVLDDGPGTGWSQLKTHFTPDYVLMFGILPAQLGISALFALNAANVFDGCTFIPTIAPTPFSQDSATKKAVWENALKPLFARP